MKCPTERPARRGAQWPARWLCLALLASVTALGCGGNNNAAVSVAISPTTVTVLVGTSIQFTASAANSSATVNWDVNGSAATTSAVGGNSTIGTITASGLYTAPAVVPNGTTITITASISSPSAAASATVTLDSGTRVNISGSGCAVGTGETYQFTDSVTGVPANAVTGSCNSVNPGSGLAPCNAVTWAVTGGTGTIDPNSGTFTAPGVAESDTITATSVYDGTQVATSTINVVASADPTIGSVTPNNGARGSIFQDIYITNGTNLICTTQIFVNGVQLPNAPVSASSTTLIARIFDTFIDQLTPGTGPLTLTFTAARPGGAQQGCSSGPCTVTLSPTRPAIVGTTPDTIRQGGSTLFTADGGFFGTHANPVVAATLGGQSILGFDISNDRQGTANVSIPTSQGIGLYPVALTNQSNGAQVVANMAVQVQASSTGGAVTTLNVGTMPTAVAVDTSNGVAVVANSGTDDISLIQLQPTLSSSTVLAPSICTGTVGTSTHAPCSVTTAPTAVAVDNLHHVALVVNSHQPSTISVIDIDPSSATFKQVLFPPIKPGDTNVNFPTAIPAAIGVNAASGQGIIAYQIAGFGSLLDLTPLDRSPRQPPVISGSVSISNGQSPRIAVSSKLNWAVVTPGGTGSLSIVDLGRQTVTSITSATQSGGIVTATTAGAHSLVVGEAILIQNLGPNSSGFNGIFNVTSIPSSNTFTYSVTGTAAGSASGGTVSYARPIATLAAPTQEKGVSINDETQQMIIADPSDVDAGSPGTIFNLLTLTSTSVSNMPQSTNSVGAAFNPLTNTAVIVNFSAGSATIIDASTPTAVTSVTVGNNPIDVAIDPVTNAAVVANQDGTVSLVPLGSSISMPQILQVGLAAGAPAGPTTSGPSLLISSTLTQAATPVNQTISIVGANFSPSSVAKLDGAPLATTFVSSRMLTATVPASLQATPRRFALQVTDTTGTSNAASFTVIQSVDVSGGCSTSAPLGVAVDALNNTAVVTDPGCNDVAVINLANGTGHYPSPVSLGAGANPQGVAVLPGAGLAVVANQGLNTAAIVDEIQGGGVLTSVATDAGPTAVAIDPGTSNAAVTATTANLVDVFPVNNTTTAAASTLPAGSGPDAIAIDPMTHNAVVANANSNSVSVLNISGGTTSGANAQIPLPTGVAFDPVSGVYMVTASEFNSVDIVNLSTQQVSSFRVGINPSSIAYNLNTSTLVTTNFLSQTMTVVDFVNPSNPIVRAVISLAPASQYAVDIHPLTNTAVVADSLNHRVLLVPLPR